MERLTRQKGPDGKELTPCSLCYMADLPICKKNSGETDCKNGKICADRTKDSSF